MQLVSETESDGVVARRFDLVVDPETVPGMHWLPAGATGPHATVCIGHGGFQHKLYGNVPELAIQLVRNLGVGVVALDAPGHGDRLTAEEAEAAAKTRAEIAKGGSRRRMDGDAMKAYAARMKMHVAEWKALVDSLCTDERWAAGPFGWWGVSMGTSHGIPVVAGDSRFTCAVFGLNALRPGDEAGAAQAASPRATHIVQLSEGVTLEEGRSAVRADSPRSTYSSASSQPWSTTNRRQASAWAGIE